MDNEERRHEEGEIYDTIVVAGVRFEIRYGYYEDYERESWEAVPIYPDFIANPMYTAEGFPFATRTQDACAAYVAKDGGEGDGWCADCVYYPDVHAKIGICRCEARKERWQKAAQRKEG